MDNESAISNYDTHLMLRNHEDDNGAEVDNDDEEGDDEEEDIHVCGSCKKSFSQIESFLEHKKTKECTRKKTKIKRIKMPPEAPGLDLPADLLLLEELRHQQSKGSQDENDRNAEEAAVISLLANQLSSHSSKTVQGNCQGSSSAIIEQSNEGLQFKSTTPQHESEPEKSKSSARKLNKNKSRVKTKSPSKKKSPQRSQQSKGKEESISKELTGKNLKLQRSFTKMCAHPGCSFTAKTSKDIVRHMRKHTGEKPFKCTYCLKAFSRKDKLKGHERIHEGIKPYECPQCEYKCTESSALKKHLRVHSDERPFRCRFCSYSAKDASQLKVHLRTHTGDCPFVCTYENCSSSFKTKSDLTRHIRIHTGEKPFKCSFCSYACAISSNLRNHLEVNHKVPDLFNCKICDFKASSRSEVKTHETIHAENLLFRCHSCSFSTTSEINLKFHESRLHNSTKLYNCQYCEFASKWEGGLSAHVNKKHAVIKANAKQNKKKKPWLKKSKNHPSFKCTFCDAAFVHQDSLKSHLRHHQNNESAEQTNNETTAVNIRESEQASLMDQSSSELVQQPTLAVSQQDIQTSTAIAFSQPVKYVKTDPVMGSTLAQLDASQSRGSSDVIGPQFTFSPTKPAVTSVSGQVPLLYSTFTVNTTNDTFAQFLPLKLDENSTFTTSASMPVTTSSENVSLPPVHLILGQNETLDSSKIAPNNGPNFQTVILQPGGHSVPVCFGNNIKQ